MGKGLIAVIGVLGIIFLMLLFPSFIGGVVDTQTDNITNTYNVTTNTTSSNATVTLSQPLFNDSTGHVTLLSSDGGGGDNPVASSYGTASRQLSLTGFDTNKTRNVTVTYRTDALTSYQGIGTVMPYLPMIGMFTVIAVILALLYRAWAS